MCFGQAAPLAGRVKGLLPAALDSKSQKRWLDVIAFGCLLLPWLSEWSIATEHPMTALAGSH